VQLIGGAETLRLCREFSAVQDKVSVPDGLWDGRWQITCDKSDGMIVRALGEDGLLKLGERDTNGLPRTSLKSTPAVFVGDELICAPLATPSVPDGQNVVLVHAKLIHPRGHVFTSLLSH
jgi:tRNA(Ile)-lysidine synthase